MRHPLRRMTLQGVWYAAGASLVKVSGLILLPVLTNTTYLSVADYGLWGVLEISLSIAILFVGLALHAGLLRFYVEPEGGNATVSASWWLTVLLAAAGGAAALLAARLLAPPASLPLYRWLALYLACEILLAVPLALLRAQERAAWHTSLQGVKLALLVAIALVSIVGQRQGLAGLARAYAGSSATTLALALLVLRRREFFLPSLPAGLPRKLLRFSVPLMWGGLGSLLLNAGDRYVLAALRPPEDLAYYSLAARFGGVVNMLAVQPLNLAWMPILFRLEERQRPEVLRQLVPYLWIAFCAVVTGVSVLASPVLDLMGSDPSYARGIPLVPWICFGFAASGLAVVTTGVLALFHRTRTISLWIVLGAVFNLALNFALVPRLGPLGSAIATLAAYAALTAAHFRTIQSLLPVRYPWGRMLGVAAVSLAAAFGGALKTYDAGPVDWAIRAGILVTWAAVMLAARWFTVAEGREIWRTLRGAPSRD